MNSSKNGTSGMQAQSHARNKHSLNMSDAVAYQNENSLSFQSNNVTNVTQQIQSQYDPQAFGGSASFQRQHPGNQGRPSPKAAVRTDKRADMNLQIQTQHRGSFEQKPPAKHQSTRNSLAGDGRKISLKPSDISRASNGQEQKNINGANIGHPETAKHQSFKNSNGIDFQTDERYQKQGQGGDEYLNLVRAGHAANQMSGSSGSHSQRNQSAPRSSRVQDLAGAGGAVGYSHEYQVQSDGQVRAHAYPSGSNQSDANQESGRRRSQNYRANEADVQMLPQSQPHLVLRQPHQPHQQTANGQPNGGKRSDSSRRGVQQKGQPQIIPPAMNQQYRYQAQIQQQQQQIEQQIQENQKEELLRLEQQQMLREQMMQKQAAAQNQGKGARQSSGNQVEAQQTPQDGTAKQSKAQQQQTQLQNKHTQMMQQQQQQRNQSQRRGESNRDSNSQQQPQLRNQGARSSKANQESDQDPAENAAFSQLVCQVPQGHGSPQMPQTQNQQQRQEHQARSSQNMDAEEEGDWLIGPQRKSDIGRKTLVLDLDETLVHSQFKPVENADIILPVEIEGQICQIYILVRPGVTRFLERMAKHYELVVFTASLSKYAEPLVATLDPEGFCSYKLFREHCTFYNNAFVKDLTRLGREMTDVIIVDNSPIAFMFQPENAIPCTSWYDDMTDVELDRIATILERLSYEPDVRKIIRRIIKDNMIDDAAEQLYLQSQKRDHSQRRTGNPSSFGREQVDGRRDGGAAQNGKVDAERGMKAPRGGHQRYESADNKAKHQAVINEKMRRKNEVAEQFSMNDPNVEQMLKKMHKSNNYVAQELYAQQQEQLRQEQERLAQQYAAQSSDGSNRKGRKSQDQQQAVNQGRDQSGKDHQPAAHPSRHEGNSGSNSYHKAGSSQSEVAGRAMVNQPRVQAREGQTASSRDPHRQSRDRDRPNGSKKYSKGAQDMQTSSGNPNGHHQGSGGQQYGQNPHVNMIYHPLTTKGNLSQTQQFNFENQGREDKENLRGAKEIQIVSNPSPNAKRSTSVKNANQVQILKEQQLVLQQHQNKPQSSNQRTRGSSAQHQQNMHGNVGPGQMKGKQAMVQSGSTAPGSGNQGVQLTSNQGQTRTGSGQRKKVQSYSNFIRNSQKLANQAYKTPSHNRQGSQHVPNNHNQQLNVSQRAQSSGNPKNNPSTQYINLSQSQRINMSNYNQNLKMQPNPGLQTHTQQSDGGTAFQKGARGSQNNQNVSVILKQSIKDFQDMIKITKDQRSSGTGAPNLSLGAYQTHNNQMLQPTAGSTKSKKGSNYNTNSGPGGPSISGIQYQNAMQYGGQQQHSQRDEASFLNKLSNQQAVEYQSQTQTYQNQPNNQHAAQAMQLPRGYPGIGLGGGVGSHAPNAVQISLNSPKYGQGVTIPGQEALGPNHALANIYMQDSANSQFNRTGPVVLNNRPPIQDPSMQMYHHLAVAPTSTKNSHAAERAEKAERDQRGVQYPRNNSKDAGKFQNSKGSSSRAPSNGQRNSSTRNSQQIPAGRGASASQGAGQGLLNVKLSKKQHQNSTTIDSQTNDYNERIMNPRSGYQHQQQSNSYQQAQYAAAMQKGQRQSSSSNRNHTAATQHHPSSRKQTYQ